MLGFIYLKIFSYVDKTTDNIQKKIRVTSSDLRASEWGRKGTEVTLVNMVVVSVPRIYWDFWDNTFSRDCREQSQKEKITSVCSSCEEVNTLMMSEVRKRMARLVVGHRKATQTTSYN